MTVYREIDRIGPVLISAVEAEIVNTPEHYKADCDHGAICGWGIAPSRNLGAVHQLSTEHAEICADPASWEEWTAQYQGES